MASNETQIAVMNSKLDGLKESIDGIDKKLTDQYVTNDQLSLRLAPLNTMRSVLLWVTMVVGAEILGLGFYILRSIIVKP